MAFQTRNSPSFNRYLDMTIEEVIFALKTLGYLIWMLDDGWLCKKGKYYISVAGGSLTFSQKNLLLEKGQEIGLNGHLVGIKSVDLAFLSDNNKRIKEIAYNYFPKSLDIMRKKINNLKC